jgi:large subunit ribosomal protein L25
MTDVHSLSAELRSRAGKGAARSTRRAGLVPAVIYGNKEAPVLISLEPKSLNREVHASGFYTTLFDIKVDGKAHRVLPRDVQFDPVTDRAIHADFMRVTATTRVRVNVPVHFENQGLSPGIKRGGVLNIVRHEIEVYCLADKIPHAINIDLTGLDIGDSVHISMIKLPEGVTPAITERDFTVATVAPPTVHKTEAEEAAAAAAAAAAVAPEGAAAAAAPAGAGAAPAGAPAAAGAPAKGGQPEKKPEKKG